MTNKIFDSRLQPSVRSAVGSFFHVALLVAVSAAIASGQDRVYVKQGVPASGRIVELTPSTVGIEVKGKLQKYPLSEVRKIGFSGEPKELDRAREFFINEQFDQALDEIKKIDAAAIKNSLVRQDIEFYRFYCIGKLGLGGNGDKTQAIRGLVALLNLNANTYHLYDSSEMLGMLAVAIGKPEQASKFYSRLASSQEADVKALGIYRLAEVELAQGNAPEARKRFAQIVSFTNNSPALQRLRRLAQVGLASCDNLDGKSDDAIKKLSALVKNNDSTNQELFSRIYNAMGAAYLSKGESVQALLSYLKTDYLYFNESEAHAEALYNLKKLFPKVGENSKAADASARLNSQYGSSVWASKS